MFADVKSSLFTSDRKFRAIEPMLPIAIPAAMSEVDATRFPESVNYLSGLTIHHQQLAN